METTPPESPTPDETAAEREETILALMSELGCSRESAEALAGMHGDVVEADEVRSHLNEDS
ncbi:hypothetical protein [Geminisphaera colitermitum]|uniref:hypothetical protein n=1 Tax=Geminisphaera colitermitum TaxID=1148786 RepID=UPI0012FEF0E2|nr:hypothetical protein [Geminisphaera colitermitum]